MRTSTLRWLTAATALVGCLAVFGVWKVGELAFPHLSAASQYQIQRGRSAALRQVGLAPLAQPHQADVGKLHELAPINVTYDVQYRHPFSETYRDWGRPPHSAVRDHYKCPLPSAELVPVEAMWKTLWSLTGGQVARRDDSGPWLTVLDLGEPNVSLVSQPLNLPAGERGALHVRARAAAPRSVQIRLRTFDGAIPLDSWTLHLGEAWSDWVLATPPHETQRELAFELTFDQEKSQVQFAALAPGTAAFSPAAPRYGPYYVERRLNSLGNRDREYPTPSPPGTVRIVCLGDSFTEGSGVKMEETFAKQLEALLAAEGAGPIEVHNSGQCAANIADYARRFRERELPRGPHVAVVALCRNDFETPELRKSWDEKYGQDFAAWDRAQREYCLREGFGKAFEELEGLLRTCRDHDVQLVLAAFQTDSSPEGFRMDQDAAQFAQQHGIPYHNPAAALSQAGLFDQQAQCGDCESHPNAAVHRLFAQGLAAVLKEQGVLERAAERARSTATERPVSP